MKTEKMGKMDTNEGVQKHMNVYQLSRSWFDFAFENPNKIKPHHSAIYFFAIEHCNRLGWKKKFGFPTSMVLDAIGMRSYSSYKKHFDELVDFGFIKVVEYSKNQYSSNIIELTFNDKAPDKALDKALIKHSAKQSESTVQSIDSIDKQINKEQINKEQTTKDVCEFFSISELKHFNNYRNAVLFVNTSGMTQKEFEEYKAYKEKSEEKKHGFNSFSGTPDKHYKDGAWCSCDWGKKLKELKVNSKMIPEKPDQTWINNQMDMNIYQEACKLWRLNGFEYVQLSGSTKRSWIKKKQHEGDNI